MVDIIDVVCEQSGRVVLVLILSGIWNQFVIQKEIVPLRDYRYAKSSANIWKECGSNVMSLSRMLQQGPGHSFALCTEYSQNWVQFSRVKNAMHTLCVTFRIA